jgi:hypothetical protein
VQIGTKPLIAREKILPAAKGKQTFLESAQCSGDCVLELLLGCPVQLLQIDAFNAHSRISGGSIAFSMNTD